MPPHGLGASRNHERSLLAAVLSVAMILPLVLQRNPVTVSKRARVVTFASLMMCVLFGPLATSRVATFGLHRNRHIETIFSAGPRRKSTRSPNPPDRSCIAREQSSSDLAVRPPRQRLWVSYPTLGKYALISGRLG
jgi:hypothetical protein